MVHWKPGYCVSLLVTWMCELKKGCSKNEICPGKGDQIFHVIGSSWYIHPPLLEWSGFEVCSISLTQHIQGFYFPFSIEIALHSLVCCYKILSKINFLVFSVEVTLVVISSLLWQLGGAHSLSDRDFEFPSICEGKAIIGIGFPSLPTKCFRCKVVVLIFMPRSV